LIKTKVKTPDQNSFIVSFIGLPWYDEVQGH